ncbi:MAG: hypothetical protein ABI625_03195 [bacterium]
MKGTTVFVVVVFIISLGIWTAYSITPYPLDAGSTVVVVGLVGLVVAAVQWLIARLRKKDTKEGKHE